MNISLPQFAICESNISIAYTKLNCEHWGLDNSTCTPFCKLKNKKTSIAECKLCNERKPIDGIVEQKYTNSLADQMKSKLPQHNYYSKENIENIQKKSKEHLEKEFEEKTFGELAAQYGRAEMSQFFGGKVSQEVFEKRKELCMECPKRKNPKPETENIGWCSGCGCSMTNDRAALSNKLWMPTLECPLKKFNKEVGEGFSPSDALDSMKGAIKSVASLFKKKEDNK